MPADDPAQGLRSKLRRKIDADLARNGRVKGTPDVMIAVIAIRSRLPIVTGNVAHFEQVRSVSCEIVVENWRAS